VEQNPFINYLSIRLKQETLVDLYKALTSPAVPLSYSSLPINALQKRIQFVLSIINMSSHNGQEDTEQGSALAASTVSQQPPDNTDLDTRVPDEKGITPSAQSCRLSTGAFSPPPSAQSFDRPDVPPSYNAPSGLEDQSRLKCIHGQQWKVCEMESGNALRGGMLQKRDRTSGW